MSYRDLKTYQKATIIYDFTSEFCGRFIPKTSRTFDQMVQAARSGKQNIVEGSNEKTSRKSELKLLGVARASFEELLEDYEDFLRQRGLPRWTKNSQPANQVRQLAYGTDGTNRTDGTYGTYLNNPESAANAMICLINQNNYLLDRQIKGLEEKFIKEGGYTENLYRRRENERKKWVSYAWHRKYFH